MTDEIPAELAEKLEPDVLAELRSMAGEGITLRERLTGKLRNRKVRTPDRALAEIEKLETAGASEIGVSVFVWSKTLGRVTGHAVGCEDHGVMPFLAPSKGRAILAAARHVRAEHGSSGSVVLVDRAPKVSVRGAA